MRSSNRGNSSSHSETHSQNALTSIAIIGGDMSAWAAAARLSIALKGQNITVTIVDTVAGAGQKPLPSVTSLGINAHDFHRALGVQEVDILKGVGGAYKYGFNYVNWLDGQNSIVSYSPSGEMINRVPFHHYLARLKSYGDDAQLNAYSISASGATQNKFTHPEPDTALANIDYALQVDSLRYLAFLRTYALDRGVKRVSATVLDCVVDDDAHITQLSLSDGRQLAADFYFDATGNQSLILEQHLGVPAQHWPELAKFDRRLDVIRQSTNATSLTTSVTRLQHGCLLEVPMQGAVHSQFSFDSQVLSDEQAFDMLARSPELIIDRRLSQFVSLRQQGHLMYWKGNCVALGEAATSFDALYFSPFELALNALSRWLRMFPGRDCNQLLIDQYNLTTSVETEHIRDVHGLISGGDVKAGVDTLDELSRLSHRLMLFKATGRVAFYEEDMLSEAQWINLMTGFNYWPDYFDPLANVVSTEKLRELLRKKSEQVQQWVARLPAHDKLLDAIRQTKS